MLGDDLHGSHLLGALLREHRFVGIREELAPAAQVADRPPELARGRPGARLDVDRIPDAVGVRLRDVALCRRRQSLEAQPRQPDGLEELLADVVHVRDAGHALDDDAEQRVGQVRVVEARAGREHHLGRLECLEQLVRGREAQRQPRVVVRLALQARRMREEPADRRLVSCAVDVQVERVLEVELSRVAQLHDRYRRERLRDGADAVLRVRRRLGPGLYVRHADRRLPDDLAVAGDGGRDARQPLVALLGGKELLELGAQPFRRGHRLPRGSARWPARSPRPRRRDA